MLTHPRRIDGPDWLTRFLRKIGIDGPDWGSRGGAISPTDGLGEQVLSITENSALAPQIFGLVGPYSYRAADGTIVSCWYSPATGWFCPNAAPVYPWWWGGGGPRWYGGNWFRGSGGNWGGHGGHHHGHHGLGATAMDALTPSTPLGWAYRIFSIVGALTGAYHGYKRNNSIGWAIGWGILGGAFPFVTVPVSLAQGFGKSRKSNHRRRNPVRLKPGQRWRRGTGELWKACTECAAPMGPFMHNLDGPDVCQRCEQAPTGQYPAARRQNSRRLTKDLRRERQARAAGGMSTDAVRENILDELDGYLTQLEDQRGHRRGALPDFVAKIAQDAGASVNREIRDAAYENFAPSARVRRELIGQVEHASQGQLFDYTGRLTRGRTARASNSRRRNGPTRTRLAEVANAAARGSRRGGAGGLTASSSRKEVIDWLQWNDPNGSHTDEKAAREDIDPYTLDEAWDALALMLEDDMDYYT